MNNSDRKNKEASKFVNSVSKAICSTLLIGASAVAFAGDCTYETPENGDLFLLDDGNVDVSGLLPDGSDFIFFGVPYGPLQPGGGIHVHSNGFITFGAFLPAPNWVEDMDKFALDLPMIAPLWDDFNPGVGGAVRAEFKVNPNRLIITWDDVPEFFSLGSNTFQTTLYLDSEKFHVTYNGVTATDGIVGVSPGAFEQIDINAKKGATLAKLKRGIGEQFTSGGNDFDLDGQCWSSKPLLTPQSAPMIISK